MRSFLCSKLETADICHASARPPAFLPTMPHIPSSLEGMWSRKAPNGYRSLNGANGLGQNPYSSHGFGLSQSETFLPLSPGHSDIAHEHDVILPIKGKCVRTLEVLLSGTWLLVSALETECSVVDRKVGLSLRDLAAASMVRMPLCLIICLACSGQNSLCATTTSLVEEIDISLN